jgi:hypothetical protein
MINVKRIDFCARNSKPNILEKNMQISPRNVIGHVLAQGREPIECKSAQKSRIIGKNICVFCPERKVNHSQDWQTES